MRVVDFLANYLNNYGINTVFMLSGTGSVYLDDAFAVHKGFKYICARHEAAASMMAEATAKLNNNIGVLLSTTGPGATNAIGGIVEAWVDSVPVLVISGQVSTNQISPNVKSFGIQGFNVIDNVKNITKYAVQINVASDIKFHLEKALHIAKSGKPGPVWIDLPMDIQSAHINPDKLKGFIPPQKVEVNYENQATKVLEYLSKSKKPLVVFGQGVRQGNAIEELDSLLREYNIPSICSRMALDILPYNHKNFIGLGGMRGYISAAKAMKETDLLIILASSYTHAFAGENFDFSCK